jgi:hypothetical protein
VGLTIPVLGYLTSDEPKKKKKKKKENDFQKKGVVTLNEKQLSQEVTIT